MLFNFTDGKRATNICAHRRAFEYDCCRSLSAGFRIPGIPWPLAENFKFLGCSNCSDIKLYAETKCCFVLGSLIRAETDDSIPTPRFVVGVYTIADGAHNCVV